MKIPNRKGVTVHERGSIARRSLHARCMCFIRRPHLSVFHSLFASTRVSTHPESRLSYNFKAYYQSGSTAREVFVTCINEQLKD